MTKQELDELIRQRTAAHELAFTGAPELRPGAIELTRQLDAEIEAARPLVRQAGIEASLKARLRVGFAGDDSAFEKLWSARKDELLFSQMKDAAAKAEDDAAAQLRKQVAG